MKDWIEREVAGLILVILVGVGLGVINAASANLSTVYSWIVTWLSDPRAVFSTALTGALVYLYFRQKSILSTQTDIQKEQIELQYLPTIRILDIGNGDENQLTLTLENVGKDIANDLHIICHAKAFREPDQYDLREGIWDPNGDRLEQFTPTSHPLLATKGPSDIGRSAFYEGGKLDIGSAEKFISSPQLMRANDPPYSTSASSVPLHRVVEIVSELEVKRITFQFTLVYRTITGSIKTKVIGTLSISIEPLEIAEELESMPTPGIDLGHGGVPESGRWNLGEMFERGTFQAGRMMAFEDEESIRKELEEEGIGFADAVHSRFGS